MNKALSECVSYASRCSESYPTPYSKRGLYMIICDMHNDSIMRVTSESGLINECNMSARHPHLQIFSAFCPRMNERAEVRRRRLMNMFNIYLAECVRLDIKSVHDCKSLSEVREGGGAYSMLAIEGGGGLFADSPELDILYQGGLRVLGMAWDTSELCSSADDVNDTGITDEGILLAKRASDMGIILDVSGMSQKSIRMLMDEVGYPVVATHSNLWGAKEHKRNLPDDIAKAIASRGGVIGVTLYPPTLSDVGTATIDDLMRQIDYAVNLVGENSIAFGFDIDGTSGIYPYGINEKSSIHDKVTDELSKRYDEDFVKKISGENLIRFLYENLG